MRLPGKGDTKIVNNKMETEEYELETEMLDPKAKNLINSIVIGVAIVAGNGDW